MVSSEFVKRHPQLLGILAAVLQGKPLREVAEAFDCPLPELQAYCAEAGLLPGKPSGACPEASVPEPEASLEREQPALGPEEEDQEVPPPRQPEGHRPDPDAHPFYDEYRSPIRELLERGNAERRAYLSQPRPALVLREDPGFRVGFQTQDRLVALIARERAERAQRVREWYAADIFRWRQTPPDDL